MTKVFLFGIDGAPPELIFDKWLEDLPNIKKLIQNGCYAKMNSAVPPSTIVAWNAMISGRDTSEIGVFSYTFRDNESKLRLVSSHNLKCKVMWDILNEHNKRSVALYVPLSYPVKPINGCMISGFLTPGVDNNCAYPEHLKEKIKQFQNNEIFFDVVEGLAGHKSLDIDTLVKRTYEMTNMQLTIAKDLLQHEEWDFFMCVMIGSDRLQHMVWRHFDETHRRFIPDSPHNNVLKEYYMYLDKQLGEILTLTDGDTIVIFASDHGMVKQEGKININNWLMKEGYLVLKENVDITKKQRFSNDFIDMDKTTVYGGGAYNARIFINKEKIGENYEQVREEIITKLKDIPDDKGNPIDTKVYKAEDIYKDSSSPECPDLTVYFDDLRWASNPDLGIDGLYSWETAVGADSAGHSKQGCLVMCGPGIIKRKLNDVDIRQVAPTVMKFLNVPIPDDLTIKPIEVAGHGTFP